MKTIIKKILRKRSEFKKAGCNLFIVAIRFLYYYLLFNKKIIAHQRTFIRGIRNIKMSATSVLYIGCSYRGFLTKKDYTLINVKGSLIINGKVSISQGVRIDVDKKGVLELNNNVGINSFTLIICADKISLGEGSSIGWQCKFLDSNFHENKFMGGKYLTSPIQIGKNVWIANNVSVCKGVFIADGCKIQEHSILDRSFKEQNCTIFTKRNYLTIKC